MFIPSNFLLAVGKSVAKAVVKYGGNAVGLALPVISYGIRRPHRARPLKRWGQHKNEAERHKEIEAVAQAAAKDVKQEVAEIVKEVAADQPPEFQQMLGTYLTQVPAMVRKSLRRNRTQQAARYRQTLSPARQKTYSRSCRPSCHGSSQGTVLCPALIGN